MSSIIFFLLFIPVLSVILLSVNFLLAPHNPYKEKKTPFECGYHSFLTQNRTQFTISFFIFALLFLVFDLEIVLIYPYSVSSYANNIYGLIVMIIFTVIVTVGFVFELGKNALSIESKQSKNLESKTKSIYKYNNLNKAYDSIESPPKPHSFVSLPLQSGLGVYIIILIQKIRDNFKSFILMVFLGFILRFFVTNMLIRLDQLILASIYMGLAAIPLKIALLCITNESVKLTYKDYIIAFCFGALIPLFIYTFKLNVLMVSLLSAILEPLLDYCLTITNILRHLSKSHNYQYATLTGQVSVDHTELIKRTVMFFTEGHDRPSSNTGANPSSSSSSVGSSIPHGNLLQSFVNPTGANAVTPQHPVPGSILDPLVASELSSESSDTSMADSPIIHGHVLVVQPIPGLTPAELTHLNNIINQMDLTYGTDLEYYFEEITSSDKRLALAKSILKIDSLRSKIPLFEANDLLGTYGNDTARFLLSDHFDKSVLHFLMLKDLWNEDAANITYPNLRLIGVVVEKITNIRAMFTDELQFDQYTLAKLIRVKEIYNSFSSEERRLYFEDFLRLNITLFNNFYDLKREIFIESSDYDPKNEYMQKIAQFITEWRITSNQLKIAQGDKSWWTISDIARRPRYKNS